MGETYSTAIFTRTKRKGSSVVSGGERDLPGGAGMSLAESWKGFRELPFDIKQGLKQLFSL